MSGRNARLRRAVIMRDGGRCRMWRDGQHCGRPAVEANHRQRRRDGGAETAANLEAACAECNRTDGGLSRFELVAPPARLSPTQTALVDELDRAGVRADAGRRAALRALQKVEPVKKYRSADVDTACRWRRHRGPLTDPGTLPRNRW